MVESPPTMQEPQKTQVWSSGKRNGNPLQYFCLENPVDRGAWRAIVHEVAKSQTRLSNGAHTHVSWGQRNKGKRRTLSFSIQNLLGFCFQSTIQPPEHRLQVLLWCEARIVSICYFFQIYYGMKIIISKNCLAETKVKNNFYIWTCLPLVKKNKTKQKNIKFRNNM